MNIVIKTTYKMSQRKSKSGKSPKERIEEDEEVLSQASSKNMKDEQDASANSETDQL